MKFKHYCPECEKYLKDFTVDPTGRKVPVGGDGTQCNDCGMPTELVTVPDHPAPPRFWGDPSILKAYKFHIPGREPDPNTLNVYVALSHMVYCQVHDCRHNKTVRINKRTTLDYCYAPGVTFEEKDAIYNCMTFDHMEKEREFTDDIPGIKQKITVIRKGAEHGAEGSN